MPMSRRRRMFGAVDASARTIVRMLFLFAAIAAAVAITLPELAEEHYAALHYVLWGFNGLLAIELVWRLWRGRTLGRRPQLIGLEGLMLVGLLVAPIGLLCGLEPDHAWPIAAFVWVLRLVPASPGLRHLVRVLRTEAEALTSLIVLFILVIVGCGVALRFAEAGGQPEAMGSLPATMWWVLVGLLTDGFPEGGAPQTVLGRVVATVVMIASLGLFGLLTGIIATGFAKESQRHGFLQARDLITRVPFLSMLSPAVVADMAYHLRRWDVPADYVIFRRGRPGESMFFIASGAIEIQLGHDTLELQEGAFFGEMAILTGAPRSATAMTSTATTLLELDVADYHRLAAQYPALAEAVEAEAARRTAQNTAAAATHEPTL